MVEAPLQFIKPREPKPEWLKVRAPGSENYLRLRGIMRDLKLNTVCEDAHCPNIGECWHHGTATFMILGDICTRACAYCAVAHGKPQALDLGEPARVGEAVEKMGLKYAVITSVDRDDLPDGGAGIFASTIRDIKRRMPDTRVEVLIPDFKGDAGTAEDGARRPPRHPQPQHRNRAAALSHGALGRQVRPHARTARSRAHAMRRTSRPRPAYGGAGRRERRARCRCSRTCAAWACRS